MKTEVIIEAQRTGYSTSQVDRTMTVGELIKMLQGYDEDSLVYLSHDNGYTYGGIDYNDFYENEIEEEEEDEDNE